MIIIDKKENKTLFRNIEEGEVFKSIDTLGSYVFMKITSIADCDDGETYNAVNLEDGDLAYFDDEEEAFPYIHSELIIRK